MNRRGDQLVAGYGSAALWPQRGPSRIDALELLTRGKGAPYVLGIDQASRSGYGVHDFAKLVQHGVATSSMRRREVLRSLRALPAFDFERLLVVFEDHSTIPLSNRAQYDGRAPTRNAATILGMGAARGRWEELLDILEHPKHLRISVEPREWRRVLGTAVNLNTDAWKAQAKMWATAVCGTRIDDDNEAEGCVMATWGAFDGLRVWAEKRLSERAARTA
jgi:hypothetical protein